GDKTVLDRVVRHAEHDGDRCRCTLGRECCGEASGRNDYRDLAANQLGRKFGESFHLLGPAIVDRYVLALDIAGFFEALAKGTQAVGNQFGRSDFEKSDHWHRGLLRASPKRPRGCRAAEQRDEIAPFHSISSSASNWIELGTSMPTALAV